MSNLDPGNSAPNSRAQVFATTHWSVVLQAGQEETAAGFAALEKLCRTYWFPLFAFIRRLGYAEADAKDLTQQFFGQLLARRDFQSVDARKGKFRTFLLAALRNFLANQRDHAQAVKRGGGRIIISLDSLAPEEFQRWEPASDLSPDILFDQRWAVTLLAEAVQRLREEMEAHGKSAQFEALKSFLTQDPEAGEYAAVATRLNSSSQTVAVTVHRLRQRYRELVRAEIARTVSSPLEVEEEMRELFAALQS
ncbi:MAG: sigma-70 family RNA polymerase sigma factor [Verrucomicrobia bacterium]|nr:sigma-70 family RNA polymerase sigma factor [Verrucomicrobiota bacterium]